MIPENEPLDPSPVKLWLPAGEPLCVTLPPPASPLASVNEAPTVNPTSAGPREFALAGALGFDAAVTTTPGVLRAEHAGAMTALPRISVNGLFQRPEYLRGLISGVPFVFKS